MTLRTAKISIGMPVYNGERFVGEALESLIKQTFADFEIIISDNASTDRTAEICRTYAMRDPRIRYVHQPMNVGATRNFQLVLDESVGQYFMWAAADDSWGNSFLEVCLRRLECSPYAVAAITNAVFGGVEGSAAGVRALDSKWVVKRRHTFLGRPGPNARFYSLYRTGPVKELGFRKYDFFAGDWAFIFDLLQFGMFETEKDYLGFFKRDIGAGSDKVALKTSLRQQGVPSWAPMLPFFRHIFNSSVIDGVTYAPALARLNLRTRRWLESS